MAEGGTRTPRFRMPKINLPTRSRGGAAAKQGKEGERAAVIQPKSEAKTEEKTETAETKAAEPKPPAAKPASGAKAPETNLQERMEGLQGWMAEIERKQGRMTYFALAGVLIALAVGGVGLYFGITAKNDSATKSDVDALTKKVDELQTAATKVSKDAQNAVNASAAQLQASIAALQKQASQNAQNISTLQSQASAAALSKGATAGTVTPGATPTTTTTPKKP